MKKKMDEERKAMVIYTGELILFAIAFAVLGVLKITKVIGYNDTRRLVFNYITLVGGVWGIADFIWYLCSKRRRARNFMPDKIAVLVLALYMIVYDIICIVKLPSEDFAIYMLGAALLYVAVVYLFQGIYHYFIPVPGYLEDIRKAIEEDKANEAKRLADIEAKKTEENNKNTGE